MAGETLALRMDDGTWSLQNLGDKVKATSAFQPGDHVCAVYSSSDELARIVASFLAEGLTRGERCWYVAADTEGPNVREALRQRRMNVDADIARGALNIIDGSDSYVVRGDFDPERTVEVFNNAIEQALMDGFTGFRAAADMSWALGLKNGAQRVFAYEALLRSLFATCRVTGLCLYDQKRMPLTVLNGALVTHPIVGIDGAFQNNPFYESSVTALPDADHRTVLYKLQSLERPSP